MKKELGAMGLDTSAAAARARSLSRGRSVTRKRLRGKDDEDMADAEDAQPKKRIHSSKSR